MSGPPGPSSWKLCTGPFGSCGEFSHGPGVLEPDPELAVAYGLFSVQQARAAGYSRADIERQVRRGAWNRRARGVLECTGRQTQAFDHLLVAVLTGGPNAVIGFISAAEVLGWDLLHPANRPQLTAPIASRDSAGYRTRLDPEDVVLVGVLPITSPLRTALDIAATTDYATAVITLDSALRSEQVTLRELQARFRASQRHGVRAARLALASADPKSGSIPESQARLLFASAGLPAPKTQYEVQDGSGFVACVDFAWGEALLVVEIDGFRYHSEVGPFQGDRTKQNATQLQDWLVLRFTVADIRQNPTLVVAQVWAGLHRASK